MRSAMIFDCRWKRALTLATVGCIPAFFFFLQASATPAYAQATPARAPDAAREIARACVVLRTDIEASAAFPRGGRHLQCDGDPADVPACAERAGDCEIDTRCTVRYTSTCTRQPCPPVANFAVACVPREKAPLARGVLQYETCVATGGRWQFTTPGDRSKPWRAECNCGPGTWEATPVDAPVWRYVNGRGCVAEEKLCAEQRGTWRSGSILSRGTKVTRLYCEIGGQPAQWGVLLPPASFP